MKIDFYRMTTFPCQKLLPKLDILFVYTAICDEYLVISPSQLLYLKACNIPKIVFVLFKLGVSKSAYADEYLSSYFTKIDELSTKYRLIYPGQRIGFQNYNFINYHKLEQLRIMLGMTKINILMVDYISLYPQFNSKYINLIEPRAIVVNKSVALNILFKNQHIIKNYLPTIWEEC